MGSSGVNKLHTPKHCHIGWSSKTRDHLFISCPYSSECISNLNVRLKLSIPSEQTWQWSERNSMRSNGRRSILFAVITGLYHHVWRIRNESLHEMSVDMPRLLIRPMNLPMQSGGSSGGGSGCSEDNEGNNSHNLRKPYHRHTQDQIQHLEGFYNQCAHPDENQRRQLGMELGLEPRQIKFWFQNKRTQTKAQNERADNTTLRDENDCFRDENAAMGEALRHATCGTCGPCGGAPVAEEKNQTRQKLVLENIELKCEYDRLSSILTYMGKPLPRPEFLIPDIVTARSASEKSALKLDSRCVKPKIIGTAKQMKANPKLEKPLIAEIAANAIDELTKLLRVDQPLWIKSPTEEQYILDYDFYNKVVSETKEFRYPNARMESSKDSGLVPMDARFLVDLYLDPDKWVDLFPTVCSKASSICVLRAGLLENRSGSLQLVQEQRHVLSPLVRQREFCLLRYCQQIEAGTWVIVDVSYDCFRMSRVSPTFCWKYPSGCMIEEMANGLSRVTCVEHVEVDDSILVHPIYEDLVKRRRGMIMLASKMIKSYCSIFKSFGAADFHKKSQLTNNMVQITIDKNTCPNQPAGIVIQAASSVWVPASPKRVFSFLNDHSMRAQVQHYYLQFALFY
ncbi:hypothetical protein KSS87_015382 [Heliosperma pusillum]|nr:hypothetical protein KSS87_015382 [Heliosperma pusillum]